MAKKTKTKAERLHLSRVAAIGCIACRKLGHPDTPAEIHHIRHGQGMAQRATNFEVIPLCAHHHRSGSDAVHQSKATFEKKFGSESQLLAETLELVKQWESSFV